VQALHAAERGSSRARASAAVGEKRSRGSADRRASASSGPADAEVSDAEGSATDRRTRLAAALVKPKRALRRSAALPDSRIDFVLSSKGGALTFVEVKSVTLAEPCAASTGLPCAALFCQIWTTEVQRVMRRACLLHVRPAAVRGKEHIAPLRSADPGHEGKIGLFPDTVRALEYAAAAREKRSTLTGYPGSVVTQACPLRSLRR
jgi:Sugar fermentation stimulation protein RE domain